MPGNMGFRSLAVMEYDEGFIPVSLHIQAPWKQARAGIPGLACTQRGLGRAVSIFHLPLMCQT
jgi:hypothetical protein